MILKGCDKNLNVYFHSIDVINKQHKSHCRTIWKSEKKILIVTTLYFKCSHLFYYTSKLHSLSFIFQVLLHNLLTLLKVLRNGTWKINNKEYNMELE